MPIDEKENENFHKASDLTIGIVPQLGNKASNEFSKEDYFEFIAFEEEKKEVGYSKKELKRAGRIVRKKIGNLKESREVIIKFRKNHERSLGVIFHLLRASCRYLEIDNSIIVSRLKRIETITEKLQRASLDGKTQNRTCVSNMDDIAGCRLILPTIKNIEELFYHLKNTLDNSSIIEIYKVRNYIKSPKSHDCGYRSLHIILKHINNGKKFKVEVQLRTINQHAWATAVEIIDLLEHTKIKKNSHSDLDKKDSQKKWENLLLLMSNYIAEKEKSIKLTKKEKNTIKNKLKLLNDQLNSINRLSSFEMMTKELRDLLEKEKNKYVLFLVNEHKLKVLLKKTFDNENEAINYYNEIEKDCSEISRLNAVLVSIDKMDSISKAYPNYIGNCSEFISLLNEAMEITE